MYATPQANGISVSWEEIPAHQQRGCITGYRLYLQKKDGRAAPDIYGRYLAKTDVIRMCCEVEDRREGGGDACKKTLCSQGVTAPPRGLAAGFSQLPLLPTILS